MFLDEPTTGLDPRSRNQVWDIVRALRRAGTTILLCTQYLDEADQLADRIAVIDHGRVIAEGTPGAAQGVGRRRRAARAPARRRAAPAGGGVLRRAGSGTVHLEPDPAALTRAVRRRRPRPPTRSPRSPAAGVGVADFSLGQPSLDEVFLALTGQPAGGREERMSRRRHDRTPTTSAVRNGASRRRARPPRAEPRGRPLDVRLARHAEGQARARAAARRDRSRR